ncbi:MAG: hypothetical protein JWN04_6388 [Myxococcaceae bacterium]|nr:hypothetical protein [Myxococcaceae bacterium]
MWEIGRSHGLWGRTSFGWLYIELLFVHEAQSGAAACYDTVIEAA